MTHRILHLSDPHATAQGPDEDGVDGVAALEQLLVDCRHIPELDAVVVTGDIADDGSVEGCARVREAIQRFAAHRGIPHVYTTGNHDARPEFEIALGTGHLDSQGRDLGLRLPGVEDELAAVSTVRGLRIITLDSLIPGSVHGSLSKVQLDALRGVLEVPAAAGTIVALHHPPIVSAIAPWTAGAGLRNRDAFAAVLADSDVVAVLCGHFHMQLTGFLSSIPVWSTPGIVTRMDATAPGHVVRAVQGASATVVEVGGAFSPTFQVLQARDPRAGEQVYLADPQTWKVLPDEG